MSVIVGSEVPLAVEIEQAVEGVPGWSPIDQLFALSTLAYATAHLDGDLVEVGTWCGRSALALAVAARDTHGLVHCIDLFPNRDDWHENRDGSFSFEVTIDGRRHGGCQQQTVWREPFEQALLPVYAQHPNLLDAMRANLRRAGLDPFVRAHRGTAETFAASAPADLRCRLIFIDGDHSEAAVTRDLAALTPFLVPGGWVCFDDAFTVYDGVNRAIERHILQNPSFDLTRQLTRKCFAARKAISGGGPR